jgi:hypothetical protein
MSEAALLLGPILFQSFEMPERIRWGGAQRLSVHRLASGARVIDALGRDDADITWCGVFAGEDATLRARALDLMRANGAVWPLTWNWYFYSVLIADFQADYVRQNWIPYRIICKVLRDEVEGAVEAVLSLASSLNGDLAMADGYGTGIGLGAAMSSISANEATTRGSSAYSSSRNALATTSAQFDTQMAATEARMGDATSASASGLNETTGLAGQLASLANGRGYVRRAEVNLANAEG